MQFLAALVAKSKRGLHRLPRWARFVSVALILAILVLAPHVTHATAVGDSIANILANFSYIFVWFLGNIVGFLFYILVKVSQYNGFLSARAVQVGWPVVLNVSNMFFIVVLLTIAF